MSQLVVDASPAVQLALVGVVPPGLGRYECLSPPLMWSEALSVLVEGAYRGDLPNGTLDTALAHLEALPIALAGVDSAHRQRTLVLARSLGWAKSYGAEYVALAQHLGCPLLTIDARLARGVAHLIELVGPSELV